MRENFPPVLIGRKLYEQGKHGQFSNIYELEKDKDLLIKEIPGVRLDVVIHSVKFYERTIENFLPRHQVILSGRKENNSQVYMVMERVKLKNLDSEFQKQFYEQLDELCSKSILAFTENSTKGIVDQPYVGIIPDIKPRNLVFGTTKSNPIPKLYCVDLFPFTLKRINEVKQLISEILNDYTNKYNFTKTRQALKQLNDLK